jgi:glycosyltransferase involved in cell wall biosynthesis
MSSLNLTVLTNIPAPYRIPTFNCLAQMTGREFQVVFRSPTEPRRCWDFPAGEMRFAWRLLATRSNRRYSLRELKSVAWILGFLSHQRPSTVICGGYDNLAAWAAFFWCKLFRRRFVLWLEGTKRDDRSGGAFRACREVLKRLMVSQADGIAASGKSSAAYVRGLGARKERIYVACLAGDPVTFAREAAKVNTLQERHAHCFPEKLVLYSGRLVHAKGVFTLLKAFSRVARELSDAGLLVVGHGPERKRMEEICRRARLDRVFFEGPQEYRRMPYYYALADVLVLPTFSDTWGFVINEAFACGVPAIVSRAAGACDDLIVEGETGFAIEPGDADGLAEKILLVLRDEPRRVRMGDACRRLIQSYSAEACACGLLTAAKSRTLPASEGSSSNNGHTGYEICY